MDRKEHWRSTESYFLVDQNHGHSTLRTINQLHQWDEKQTISAFPRNPYESNHGNFNRTMTCIRIHFIQNFQNTIL